MYLYLYSNLCIYIYIYIWLCILYLWLLEFIYLATVWKCKKHVAELSCLTFRPTTFTPIRSLLARSRVGPCFPASFLVFFFLLLAWLPLRNYTLSL